MSFVFLIWAAGCASAPRIVFPSGTAEPVPDAVQLWWSATQACKGAATFTAEIHLSGSVGAEKVPTVKLQSGVTQQGEIRLVAVAPFGSSIFTLAGRADRATLTLPRERRVLVAPAVDIVEALIGLRLTPLDWLDLLSGCVAPSPAIDGVRINGITIINLKGGGTRVRVDRLDKDGAAWRLVAGERPDVSIEYQQFDGRWPSLAKLSSRAGAAVNVSLTLKIGQIFVNTTLPKATFDPPVSAGFQPMSLAELRAIGPLGESRSTGAAGNR